MPICIICGTPNSEDTKLKYFDLPTSTSNPEWHAKFMNELGIIGESDEQLRNMKICENHFNDDDIVLENGKFRLKESALPINNLIDNFDHYYVKPELVYMNADENVQQKDGEEKNFTDLNPLVVYAYKNEESDQEQESYDCAEYITDHVETEIHEQEEDEEVADNYEDENVQVVEPMMPFFLTDPSMFTIINESEVGETIVVQIENDPPEVQQYEEIDEEAQENDIKLSNSITQSGVMALERSLCSSEGMDFSRTYVCDICNKTYGCMPCLKSHYESMHIARLHTVRYKCHNSPNCPKSLYCPVCELIFETKTDTLDHYVTHYVACDICTSAFDRSSSLAEHMKSEHNKIEQYVDYECELCRNSYQYSSYLSKHYQAYHKMNLCTTCKIRFRTVQELHDHEITHVAESEVLPYACSRCNMAFPKISDITVHIRAVHKQTPTELFVNSLGNNKQERYVRNVIQKVETNKQINDTKKVKLKK